MKTLLMIVKSEIFVNLIQRLTEEIAEEKHFHEHVAIYYCLHS